MILYILIPFKRAGMAHGQPGPATLGIPSCTRPQCIRTPGVYSGTGLRHCRLRAPVGPVGMLLS